MWCRLLGVTPTRTDEETYARLVASGRSRSKNAYGSISEDVKRTFRTDDAFLKRVPEDMLERVLVSFVSSNVRCRYTQGMAQWCGLFLYDMPETTAFLCFRRFVQQQCPRYMQKGNPGAHDGVVLLERCLDEVAPALMAFLREKIPGIQNPLITFAFAPVLSLSASLPPLCELRHMWDIMIGFGAHLNVLFIMAYIIIHSKDVFASSSLVDIQRVFDPRHPKPLHARSIVHVAFKSLPKISAGLYEKLKRHSASRVD